ncbi:MAG TPA: FAD-dependent oxidoreductase [Pyrinomonadaceae bacterium]|nr:FAD-dependent oxidoreductase [Pyrinomonadaceae bacterium]
MASILILGGGFGGVVAAESLARLIPKEHQITLVSRSPKFTFYPELVRLAFGHCEPDDISFDLREAMLDRRIRFIEAEVARIKPHARRVVLAHGEVEGELPYDFLIFALGRRLATERITGFFEHSNHLLNVEGALKFGEALRDFHDGRAIIGQCPGARLPVPVYETAFALRRLLEERGEEDRIRITVISPDDADLEFGDADVAGALLKALDERHIEYLPDFPINTVAPGAVITSNGHAINYGLLMLLPPFRGPGAVIGLGITDDEGFIGVDWAMRVQGVERMYAVGDCVNFGGPKMGHMAVHQAEVAAANVALAIKGHDPFSLYNHEMMMVIDEGGGDSIYLHKGLWDNEPAIVRQGRFWSWAKRIHDKYWLASHS